MAQSKTTSRKKTQSKTTPVRSSLVRMVHPSGKTADVHPDMVDSYKRGNYRGAD